MKRLFLAIAFSFAASPALAQDSHGDNAEVVSIPVDDAVLSESPPTLSLSFEHPVTLTEVTIHGPGHAEVPTGFAAATSAAPSYSIALPPLPAGAYEVHWRATGVGHDMTGTLHFSVQ